MEDYKIKGIIGDALSDTLDTNAIHVPLNADISSEDQHTLIINDREYDTRLYDDINILGAREINYTQNAEDLADRVNERLQERDKSVFEQALNAVKDAISPMEQSDIDDMISPHHRGSGRVEDEPSANKSATQTR